MLFGLGLVGLLVYCEGGQTLEKAGELEIISISRGAFPSETSCDWVLSVHL